MVAMTTKGQQTCSNDYQLSNTRLTILNELAHQFIQNHIMTRIFYYPWTVHGQSDPTGLTQRLAVVLP